MKIQILLLSSLLLLSCSQKEEINTFPFDDFVFSSAGESHDDSMKFTKSDTVYFQKRFPDPIENSYAILKTDDRIKLNKLLQQVNFKKFDSVYEQENLQDGESYLINISNKGKNKWIYLYGHVIPKELDEFIDSLGNIKAKLKFLPTNKIADFGDLKYILPPPPPPMKIESIKK
ncbi:hypothetical protein [Flavobacterium sp. 5]|uniref:DUF6438 domain-containing protein n=1 Tax=Flavobacterium sp. 5 TaxID=2035199 RepID=UPI000C2C5354|nr:hypothetical protein [Flavobacterium sp. 5]PKB18648.1 hypothetical protein CLU82_3939 [Flavobacterium sp. 5]